MTKEKSKEDIKYYFFSFMKISNTTVTSKQNFTEKYHRLMKNLYGHCQKEDAKNAHTEKRAKNDKTEISGLIFMLKT